MCSPYENNENRQRSRGNRDQENEVCEILRRRQRNTGHRIYGIIAAAAGCIALLVWGFILSDVQHEGGIPLTKAYAAFLAFATILGIAGSASTFTWMIVREGRAQAADEDVIREFRQQEQLVAIREAVSVFLADGDESAARAMARTRGLLDTGTDPGMGAVRQFPRRS